MQFQESPVACVVNQELAKKKKKKKKSVQSMSAKGPRTSEKAGNAYTSNFSDRLYATLWLKAHRFKLNVTF